MQVWLQIVETNKPANGECPWEDFPLLLIQGPAFEYYNNFRYIGRNLIDYKMAINFIIQDTKIKGELRFSTSKILLPEISLNRLEVEQFDATWLNVAIPGSGFSSITVTIDKGV